MINGLFVTWTRWNSYVVLLLNHAGTLSQFSKCLCSLLYRCILCLGMWEVGLNHGKAANMYELASLQEQRVWYKWEQKRVIFIGDIDWPWLVRLLLASRKRGCKFSSARGVSKSCNFFIWNALADVKASVEMSHEDIAWMNKQGYTVHFIYRSDSVSLLCCIRLQSNWNQTTKVQVRQTRGGNLESL